MEDLGLPMPDPPDPYHIPTQLFADEEISRAQDLLDIMPEMIGPYRILERIGGGGMGDVYRAEQRTPIRREVALKVIRLGMDTKAVIARFEAERQALALMDHAHIAKIFDAGVDETGRPFFVMEYVKGLPLNEYADQQRLTVEERLLLFEQVCEAVQHAHQKGIIHRDLKPTNVLVSTQDGRPFVMVIDFGLAKALSQKLTEKTLFTRHNEFVGTPLYASPEQAAGSLDIDTRSDVYSLGVLLYELLAGTPPFTVDDFKQAAFEEFKKMVREVDPPKPSTRLSQSGPILSTLAASRCTPPNQLGSLVRGELDWIVMKSLEKDRQRRYHSAAELVSDLQAHQSGKPILAAPPSATYRIQKFVRRHRSAVFTTLFFAASFFIGISMVVWQEIRNVKAVSQSKENELRAEVAEREKRLADSDKIAATKEVELVKIKSEVIRREAAGSRYIGLMGQLAREETKRAAGWAERSWELVSEAALLDSSMSNAADIRSAAATILIADEFRHSPDWVYQRARSVDYSPDGKWIAICVYSDYSHPTPRIHILNAETGKLVQELSGADNWDHEGKLTSLRSRFSSAKFVSGNTLLALTENGRLYRFELNTSPPTSQHIDIENDSINVLMAKPGVPWCAIRSQQNGLLHIWNWKTFKLVSEISGIPDRSEFLMSPDWKSICWANGDTTKCYSLPDLEEITSAEQKRGAVFHPFAEFYIHVDENGLSGRNWPGRQRLHAYEMPKNFVHAAPQTLASTENPRQWDFSRSGRFLTMRYQSERKSGVRIWDAWGGPLRSTLAIPEGHHPKWDVFAFSGDDSKIALMTEKTHQFSRLRNQLHMYRAEGHPDACRQICVTPQRNFIALLGERNLGKTDSLIVRKLGEVPDRFQKLSTMPEPIPVGSIPPEVLLELTCSPDGNIIVSVGGNSADSVSLYCIQLNPPSHTGLVLPREGKALGKPAFNPGKVAGFGWSENGSMILAADTQLRAYQTKTMPPSEIHRHVVSNLIGTPSPYVSFSMNGSNTGWVLTLSSELQKVVFQSDKLQLQGRHKIPGEGSSRTCTIDPSNQHLAIGKNDGTLVVFNTSTHQFGKLHPNVHLDTVQALYWLNETRLISGAKDGTIAIWDLSSEGELKLWYRLDLSTPILDIAPTQNSTSIYLAMQDETSLRVLDLDAIDSAIQDLRIQPSGELAAFP